MIHGRTIYWGCMWQCTTRIRSVDSLGQQFLDLLDQVSWCHAGMPDLHAAQVWHGMSQTLVPGHSSEQLVWQGQLGLGLSGMPVSQMQQLLAACMVQLGVMQVVPLRSSVLSEPVVWQLCHLGQCQLPWHCIHEGVFACSSMWNHCWCRLDSCPGDGHLSQWGEPKCFWGCHTLQLIDQHTVVQVFCYVCQPVP